MRINVCQENSEDVIWYKRRFLGEKEIVDHIVHNASNTICWTVHRPIRGWYIRLRSPLFPPGVFIPLTPVSQKSPHFVEGALSFNSRTNVSTPSVEERQFTLEEDTDATPVVHSYPPTPPPALNVQPPSPKSVSAKLSQVSSPPSSIKTLRPRPPSLSTQVSQFVLAPEVNQQPAPTNNSIFARALSALRYHRPKQSNTFTLTRIPAPMLPYLSNPALATLPVQLVSPSTTPPPILTFLDQTPVMTFGATSGIIELNQPDLESLGVEASFWVSVALTYLDFLENRASYLSALED
ncbi:hypothetical protein BDN72DRAFT_796839 [Pluteus cervinus]|uniref:Uncharacterized protein n=1 Tax=Pluteus cervinus TaxID=181527 RepID=A0ACD3ATA2_9AGAR|nr:hypothetical protein BDN72DRAFT_796839 [Pluteus cervinus]